MIELSFFAFADEQWKPIGIHIKAALGVDADDIGQITPIVRNIIGIEPLRTRIETAASMYPLHSAAKRPRREELTALRKSAGNLEAGIIKAIAVPIGSKGSPIKHPLILPGADADILTATSRYFRKLLRNLDRMVEQARPRRESARKIDRDQYWNELMAIWCELGGKATGRATANFLMLASKPVIRSAVPDIASIMRWLERRQKKTVSKPVLRR